VLQRYGSAVAVVLGVSLLIALIVYAATPHTYTATCIAETSLPPTQVHLGSDFFVAAEKLATEEVARSLDITVYRDASRGKDVDPDDLARHTRIAFTGGGAFDTIVDNSDSSKAVSLANAVCGALVTHIRDRATTKVKDQADMIAARITQVTSDRAAILATDATVRTPAQQATLAADDIALKALQNELAGTIGTAPNPLDVASTAQAGQETDTGRSLSRDLVIGAVAGVLASFLIILVGEIIAERRPGGGGPAAAA
jgi:hypothetical protein